MSSALPEEPRREPSTTPLHEPLRVRHPDPLAEPGTARLTELARHLQHAREDERQRLARDLHDELGALLTAAKLDAARIRARLGGGPQAPAAGALQAEAVAGLPATWAPSPEATRAALERLDHLGEMLNQIIALTRRVVEDLHPSALHQLGLVSTLEQWARELGERSGLVVHCELSEVPLAPPAQLLIYRLVQEASTNLCRHAAAQQVWLRLGQVAGRHGPLVQLELRDDGCGFKPETLSRPAGGLAGMRFRVECEQGEFTLQSAPGQGTRILVHLPVSPVLRP